MNYERSYVLHDVQYVYRPQTECLDDIYEISTVYLVRGYGTGDFLAGVLGG